MKFLYKILLGNLFKLGILCAIILYLPTKYIYPQRPQWIVYNYQNSSIPDETLGEIVIDSNNIKWIGSTKGLIKFNGVNWFLFDSTNSPIKNPAGRIKKDKHNNIWFTVFSQGLFNLIGNNFINYNTSNSPLPSNTIFGFNIEADTIKWLGSGRKLVKFDNKNWTILDSTNSGYKNADAWYINITDSTKWIAAHNRGLLKYDNVNWTYYDRSNSGIQDNILWSISLENKNVLWTGSYFGGVSRFDVLNNNWTIYNSKNSPLPNNDFRSVFYYNIDSTKFFGSSGFGLSTLKGTSWNISISPVSPSTTVTNFTVDKYNNIWISTHMGLFIYNPNGVVSIENNISKIKNFKLSPNYPNPFNPITNITFNITKSSHARLGIFDLNGKNVESLLNSSLSPGEYKVQWNAANYSSGVYYYRLTTENFSETKKMILIK